MAPEPGPQLRLAGGADAAAIRDLVRAAYAKWVPVIGREPLPMGVDYDLALRENRFDLLMSDQQLVGLIETARHDDHLMIVNLAVAPEHQGRGNGRRLLAHAESLAAAAGVNRLRLYTNGRFDENIALYRRLGYAIDREEPFRGGVVVHMSKQIERRAPRHGQG